jgi:hypothetical protein
MALTVISGGGSIANGSDITITPASGHTYSIHMAWGTSGWNLGNTSGLFGNWYPVGSSASSYKAIINNSNPLVLHNSTGAAGGYWYTGYDQT